MQKFEIFDAYESNRGRKCRKARTKLDARIFYGHSYDYVTICDVTYWTLCTKYAIFCRKVQCRICGRSGNITQLY